VTLGGRHKYPSNRYLSSDVSEQSKNEKKYLLYRLTDLSIHTYMYSKLVRSATVTFCAAVTSMQGVRSGAFIV
jgi:hypothetical protein